MTVKELIATLEQLPQNDEVKVELNGKLLEVTEAFQYIEKQTILHIEQ